MKKNLKEMTKTKRSRGLASRCRLLLAALLLVIGASAQAQIPETGIHGTTVVLNDLEDHTWTYYAGVDESVDDGYYKENYEGIIYSPGPRDVEIHYQGGSVEGASAVAISGLAAENQNEMVYYLTLEEHPFEKWLDGDGSQPYPYQVISNPFSKRPAKTTDGTTTYYGFDGWKIISGGNYISGYNDGQVIPLDAIIHFTNLADGNAYATGSVPNVITLEATWTEANVKRQSSMPTFTGGTYETNFWVMTANYTSALTLNQNMTITAQSPDGGATIANGNYYISNTITVNNTFTGTPKLEWLKLSGNSNINAGGRNLYLGRGITNNGSSYRGIFGCSNRGATVNQIIIIESGVYERLRHFDERDLIISKQIIIHGCDYDRALEKNESFNYANANLKIRTECSLGSLKDATPFINPGVNDMTCYVYGKSGNILSNKSVVDGNFQETYYMSLYSNQSNYNKGCTYLEVKGGLWCGISGGWERDNGIGNHRSFTLRMKGGKILGVVYGSAEYWPGCGIRTLIFTGGIINGWIAGGANGSQSTGGINVGSSYVYVGGNTIVKSDNDKVIRNSVGGNVYGAGCGYSASSTSGEMTKGTNVVITDNAYVEHGVYGGGAFGFTTQTSNIYIAGNCTIDGKYDSKSGTFGGVYGGAKQNKAGNVNIYMTGGTVNGGINGSTHGSGVFGGSNASGVLTGNTNIKILGGTLGSTANPANVHGGGYGASTEVTGNIAVAIGEEPEGGDKTANKENIEDLTINGDVYGGSALGKTNTAASKTTAVNMFSGTVNGNVYGGALGSVSQAAQIKATSQTVDIYGGKVTGAVYGGSNINASMTASPLPQQGVTVHATSTPAEGEFAIGSVFGGGNGETAANSGQPGAHDNNANGTFVTVEDGYIGNVYGGGNNATVGKGTVNINGGTFGNVFGGGNRANVINTGAGDGCTTVNINNCSVTADAVYGGCNAAHIGGSATTTIWGGTIGTAFAGGNGAVSSANVGGNATLNIHGGVIGQAFAGSNTQGSITGNMEVFIDQQAREGYSQCPETVGEVYGGGNLAAGKAGTITIDCTAEIGDLYGGANQADVTGDIFLNVTQGKINRVFGGNNTSGSINGSITVNIDKDNECDNFSVGYVYGGGNLAAYDANGGNYPVVNLIKGTVTNDVFGGGLGTSAVVTGNPHVNVSGGTAGNVYGGGSQANVNGNTAVSVNSGSVTQNVFGGGYGANTNVSGNVEVTIGDATHSPNIGRDVYGGSALGSVNTDASNHTYVTVNNGAITGAVYGGGLGSLADNIYSRVNGTVKMDFISGTAGNIFGCNNLYGAPQSTVQVNMQGGTVHNVYGGGNTAAYTGTPDVNITGGMVSEAVYGGGYGADALITGSTDVNISGATTSVRDVYGGGWGGSVTGNTQVTIPEGQIGGNVFGGGYGASTNVGGNVSVTVGTASAGGPTITGDVYGGSALGSVNTNTGNHTKVTVNDVTSAGNIYGGGLGDSENAALENGTVEVEFKKGTTENIFGCNNVNGAPQSTATVNMTGGTVNHSVYGGSNQAAYSGNPAVNITGGEVKEDVFGAGLGEIATVSGDTEVNVSGTSTTIGANIYGGGKAGAVNGNTVVNATNLILEGEIFGGGLGTTARVGNTGSNDGSTSVNISGTSTLLKKNIYGGGSAGPVYGHTSVTMPEGEVKQNVFGGGLGETAVVTGNTGVSITGVQTKVDNNVYGGGSAGSVNGEASVSVTDANVLGNVYGAGLGEMTTTGSTNVSVAGQTTVGSNTDGTGNVYGGGEEGDVKNGTNVVVGDDNAQITNVKNVYGAGKGTESDVKCTDEGSHTSVTIKKSALVRGNVFGGSEQGTINNDNIPTTTGSTGGHEANGKKVAVVTVESGRIMGNVYGGGELGATAGQTLVNMEGGTVEGNVFGGALGEQGQTLVYGLKTVNMTDGVVLGDIYGGSQKANDTNEYEGEGDEATGSHSTVFVNVSGGSIAQNVYGGGFYGTISGNVTVNIGVDAILNGTDFARNTNKLTLNDTDKKLLNIEGSVYAGSDWGEITVGSQFGPANISGYSNIYIDGAGYDMQAEMLNTNNYMNIAGSIYGAGTSSDAGKKGRRIFIRNYGLDQTATVDGALTYTECTRKLYSIQRADSVYLEDTHITFIGQGDMSTTSTTKHYAILNVFHELRQVHNSTIDLQFPVDRIQSYSSYTLPAGKTIFDAAVSDYQIVYYQNYTGTNRLHDQVVANDNNAHIDNKLRMNDGTYFYVRYPQGWNDANDNLYGEFTGFINMVVPLDYSFAFARPKVTKREVPALSSNWAEQNATDGGFCSYKTEYNTFDEFGGNTAAPSGSTNPAVQHPYTNQLPTSRADSPYYRYWMIQGTHPQSKREIVLVAQTDGASVKKYLTASGTVTLNPLPQGGYVKVREQWGEWGEDAVTVNATKITQHAGSNPEANDNWAYFVNGSEGANEGTEYGPVDTISETPHSFIAPELRKIDNSPNNVFGLSLHPTSQLTKIQKRATASDTHWEHPTDVDYDMLIGRFTTTDYPFLSNHRFLAENATGDVTIEFNLTYSNQINRNTVLSPMTIFFEQYDANGNLLYTTEVSVTITTQTAISQDFDEPCYAVMFGKDAPVEKYSVKATLPIFPLESGHTESTFRIMEVGPFQSNETLENVSLLTYEDFAAEWIPGANPPVTPMENHIAMKFGPSLTYDNTLGWVNNSYSYNDPEASLYDLMAIEIPAEGFVIGQADGRQNLGLQFDLYYNGSIKCTDENDIEIGRLPIKLSFDNVQGLTPEQSQITITVVVIKRGHGTDWYIDGQHGYNANAGHNPNKPKYSLKGVLFDGYKPGDNIYVTDKIVVAENSKWPEGTDISEGVTLYRYPGRHRLEGSTELDPNTCYRGPLIEVESSLELFGITLDGLNSLNDVTGETYEVNSVQYPIYEGFAINSSAPLAVVKNGGTLTLNSSTLTNNRNDGNNGAYGLFKGGAVWVQDGGTLTLKEGAVISGNLVIGNTAEGAGVYVNSERATVNVMETVTVTDNTKKATESAISESRSNVYLPTAESVITVDKTTGLNTNSVIGITKTVFPTIGGKDDFTPVAYSVASHQAEVAYGAHISDDGRVYSIYYDPQDHDGLSANDVYFVKTWASEVHSKPDGWNQNDIKTPEDLAWLISVVNGYNGQNPAPETNATLTADIDMDERIWVPIGDATNSFQGTFDGNGYEITGLRSNLSGNDGLGLFGTVNGGTVRNTFVTNGTLKSIDSRYLGSIAGIVRNGTVESCEGALNLETNDRNTIMGGLVGLLDNSTLHSSIAVADLTGYRMGGLIGETKGNTEVGNSYTYTKFVDAKLRDEFGFIIPNNDLVAGLVADNASMDENPTTKIENCYVRLREGNDHDLSYSQLYAFDAASKTGNSIASCYYYNGDTYNSNLTATANPTGIMPFDEAKHPYTYAENYNHVIEGSGELGNYFVDMLNKKAEDNEHAAKGWLPWFRTSSDINGDYPLPKMGYDNASKSSILLAVSSDRTNEVLHFHHSLDEAFTRYTTPSGKDNATPVVAAYANAGESNVAAATVTVAQPDGLELYINEDVAILQPAPTTRDANPLTAHVGITLDNSAGPNGANPTYGVPDEMDWHMFSSPLADAPLGIAYENNNEYEYWWQGQLCPFELDTEHDGYFPTDTPKEEFDFYCYFEPEYHWINFKRNGNSHWHEDGYNGIYPKIDYWYTPNGSTSEVHGNSANNESELIQGKGYLFSSKEETSLHSSGTLNNGDVVYHDVTKMNNASFPALNLLGNPYQSYLDFDLFATANSGSGKIWSGANNAFYIILDEDKQGYVYYHYDQSKNDNVSASKYLHMHQGFFVVSEVAGRTSATFTNDMRLATGTPVDFRDGAEKAAYPLINLILSEESGNKDYAVIELDRPKAGGAVKAKTVRAGAGQIYARYNDEDYAIAFTTPGLTSIPVRFNTNRDDVFTLTWTTLNADFSYLHLIDNITGTDVDCLLSDEYVFYANTYDLESRFKLVFQYTGVEENDGAVSDSNFAFVSNGEFIVNGEGRLECIDLQGRSLFATDLYGTQNRVALPDIASGLYVLRLVNGKQIKVQKIVIN